MYTLRDLEQNRIIPPCHSNCKCILAAVDKSAEVAYNLDKQKFLESMKKSLEKYESGVYLQNQEFKGKGISFNPLKIVEGLTISDGDGRKSNVKWYNQIRDWAVNFGKDANAAWNAIWETGAKRTQNMGKDIPSFLDWLSLGAVSGAVGANTERFEQMQKDPTIYNAVNWLLLGVPDTVDRAINTENPFSFEQWMASLETVTLAYGGYQAAKQAMSLQTPSGQSNIKPIADVKTELDYTPTSGVKLKAVPDKTTTVLGSFKKDLKLVVDEMGDVKSTNFGERKGSFNVLNVPDELYLNPQQFWDEYNRPWLDKAISRKDKIVLASKPDPKLLYYDNALTNTHELTGFGREYEYLLDHGYQYAPLSNQMILE